MPTGLSGLASTRVPERSSKQVAKDRRRKKMRWMDKMVRALIAGGAAETDAELYTRAELIYTHRTAYKERLKRVKQ